MPVKRSRIGRSSSIGEAGLLNQLSPAVDSPDLRWNMRTASASTAVKPSVVTTGTTEQSQPRILTLSSPVEEETDEESVDVSGEGFLEKCYYCKKKISENDEVFMYSYLCAFCSTECRDKQIAMEREVKKVSRASMGTVSGYRRMNNVKDQFDSQVEKPAAPLSHIK